jgi:hypothetical protein
MDRLFIRRLQRDLDRMNGEIAGLGFQADGALYGTIDAPTMLVLVIDTPVDQRKEEELFGEVGPAIASGGDFRLDLDRLEVSIVGAVRLRCAPITGGPKVSMCMWVDEFSTGFVAAFVQDVGSTRDLTNVVRMAVRA